VPIPDEIRGPGDAVGALQRFLQRTPTIYFRPRDLADDLIALRGVYINDDDYTAVLVAFWKEIRRALRNPKVYGGEQGELRRDLAGVRRYRFPPEGQHGAVLRLLVRPYRDGIHIVAMRHRHEPPGMYGLAEERFPPD
jgi:hypothetical protein